MTVPADLSNATMEELRALANDVSAEVQKRQQDQRLLDDAWSLVLAAKNQGFDKAQVSNALRRVVEQAYGEVPAAVEGEPNTA